MEPVTQANLLPTGQLPNGDPDFTGRILADFHLLRHLGQGGMGQVYLAEQISLKRKVALKILRPEMAADPTSLQRFKAEATAVAQATHANIVQIYAIGEADGLAYMALEYVEGRNLREYLQKKGPPEVVLALSLMRQVANALQRAAELGIIHRDIKPENILLTRKGEVKVADFGLSRCLSGDRPALNLTQSGVTMGTPLYMSPEQVEGKTLDCRTDIYSFGVTCYHMLAGHPPFQGDSPFEVALQHVRVEPKALSEIRPDLPPGLCAIVHKMMAKDPAARYQTCRDLLKDIGRVRDGLSGQTATLQASEVIPITTTETIQAAPKTATMPRYPSRRGLWAVVAASFLLTAACGAGVAWFRHRSAFPIHGTVAVVSEDSKPSDLEQEKALRTVVEQYLAAGAGDRLDNQAGATVCAKLGFLYLERDRLDDALILFTRMSKHGGAGYPLFGQVGRAITLALQSKAVESNTVFQRVFSRVPPKQRLNWMWQEEKWRFWIRKALFYNRQNGVPLEDIPQPLHKFL
jgi:tRNA A-37 threonylcarbamoyl transferase component Bud32